MFIRTKKGQAILEYIIILTALVAAFALAKQVIQNNTQNQLQHVSNQASALVGKINFLK